MTGTGNRWDRFRAALDPAGGPRAWIWQVLAVAVVFRLVKTLGKRHVQLVEEDYFGSFILPHLFLHPVALFAAALIVTVPFVWWRRLRWSELSESWHLRGYVVAIAAILAWAYACMPYNPYYGQMHLLDRLLLLAGVGLIAWHPAFVAAFYVVLTLFIRQVDFPLLGYSFTDKQPVIDMLVLVVAFCVVRVVAPRMTQAKYFLFAVALMGSWYFTAGFEKIKLGWPLAEELHHLVRAAADNGAHFLLRQSWIDPVVEFTRRANPVLIVFTLAVELGALVALWRRWLTVALLFGLVGMHVGIAAVSGIWFWKWIVVDLLLVAVLLTLPVERVREIYNRRIFVASVVLILFGGLVFRPMTLAWFDTPLSTLFRIEAVREDGTVTEVIPAQLRPYDLPFSQGRFYYLCREPILVGNYGMAKSREILDPLIAAESIGDVRDTIERVGRPSHDQERIPRMERFLRRYFGDLNRRPGRYNPLAIVPPPLHMHSGHVTGLPPFDPDQRTARVRVRRVSTWLADTGNETVLEETVLEVEIP